MDKDFLFLETPIHKNFFKEKLFEEVKSNFLLSFDGTIMAVKQDFLDGFDLEKLSVYKAGYKKADVPRKISTIDDIKKVIYYSM